MTVVLLVILALIAITFAASRVYLDRSDEAACIVLQGTIGRVLISHANLEGIQLEPGIDYAQEPDFAEKLGFVPNCPAVGGYSAFLGPDGELIIRCVEHGHGE